MRVFFLAVDFDYLTSDSSATFSSGHDSSNVSSTALCDEPILTGRGRANSSACGETVPDFDPAPMDDSVDDQDTIARSNSTINLRDLAH